MKTLKQESSPLRCCVENKQLVIRIGIDTLAFASKVKNGGPIPNKCGICDKEEFAFDVARAMSHEDEVGNTIITDVITKAIQIAYDSGSVGITYR